MKPIHTFYFFICCMVVLGFVFSPVAAQRNLPAVTWEEASLQAARDNKLVFVAVDLVPDKKIFSNETVKIFFERNLLPVYMDMQTEEGIKFESKLLLTPYPVYAFFMPFGDLLLTVEPAKVAGDPLILLDAARKARELAEVKKNNSRSVNFIASDWQDVLIKAREEKKPVFVYFRKKSCRECLFIENNVFHLDRVADFYNRNFLPYQVDISAEQPLLKTYGIEKLPAYLFVNEEGKVIHLASGKTQTEEILQIGEEALCKAQGVKFSKDSWEQVLAQARQEKKGIYVDCYTLAGGERRPLTEIVYRDPEIAVLMNEHFINYTLDRKSEEGKRWAESYGVTSPFCQVFLDSTGKLVHLSAGIPDTSEFKEIVLSALAGRGIQFLSEKYEKGDREAAFVEEYIRILGKAGLNDKAEQVVESYLGELGAERLKDKKYWELFRNYVINLNSELFKYVSLYRTDFFSLFGREEVLKKIQQVWTEGAEGFVTEREGKYRFDEAGFKIYVKRLKAEKIENWRNIVRKARMNAAEKTENWKVYAELAEERWNEEQIPEAELYSWGIVIKENCRDKSIRYKAARWFALAVAEIEKKERLEGKVRVSSYKGFFEKLVNDLVEE